MATRKRSELEEDRMTPANIEKVLAMLAPADPEVKAWTKKEACQALGMAYNTTRLTKILSDYTDKQKRDGERRAALRGKPATQDEVIFIIQEYLEGATVDAISKSTYRGSTFIKAILDKYEVPLRQVSQNYFDPALIPDGTTRERFSLGEVVYSARYDTIARVDAESHDPRYGWIYRIWLLGDKWKESAWQEAYELASLQHLRELGVRI
jgi:hypothetical protein